MTENDLTQIEAALGITLPAAYRLLVVPFPVPSLAGNADTELWDDPDKLIELNRELRVGLYFSPPWPVHMFALGQDSGGSANAIDLRDPAGPVWWADRCILDVAVGSYQVSPSLEAWAVQCLADLRHDLVYNGIDPDGTPEAKKQVEQEGYKAANRLLLKFVVLLGVSAAVAIVLFGLWARSL